jgi:manganese transport protein
LLHVSLLAGMAVTAVATVAILLAARGGFRPLELVIGALVAVISLCYVAEMVIVPVDWRAAAAGLAVPSIPDAEALTIAVGIIGATVMPHALFLHSGLTQHRAPAATPRERGLLVRFSNREVVAALTLAGLVNMAMIAMAASAFHAGHGDVAEIATAYHTLTPLLGGAAAGIFLASLIASGLSSSAVGTLAGQIIMQGFVRVHIPVWLRRLVTMIPAFVVAALGFDVTHALVLSQVVLSIALPVPMIALVLFTRRRDLMGVEANGTLTQVLAVSGTALVLVLNVLLILQACGIAIPGLPSG